MSELRFVPLLNMCDMYDTRVTLELEKNDNARCNVNTQNSHRKPNIISPNKLQYLSVVRHVCTYIYIYNSCS